MKNRSTGVTAIACAMTLALTGCTGVDDAAKEISRQEMSASPIPDAPKRSAAVTAADPRGVKVRNLAGRAYVIEEFGVAPPGDAAEVVERLKPLAKSGDAATTYALYLKIRQCVDQVSVRPGAPRNPEVFEQCKRLAADDYVAAGDWLALAADQGSVPAQLLYATDAESVLGSEADMLRDPDRVKAYKVRAVAYLNHAAEGGSVDALLLLASAYRNGVLVDENPGTSYAYFDAARAVSPELIPVRDMEEVAGQLGPKELAASTQKGRGIYEQCCRK